MGLECSHDAFEGSYYAFMSLRIFTLYAAGGEMLKFDYSPMGGVNMSYVIPGKMKFEEGFEIFFTHSDCDGSIGYKDCKLISQFLTEILPNMQNVNLEDIKKHVGDRFSISKYIEMLKKFIAGCNLCFEEKEDMMFF